MASQTDNAERIGLTRKPMVRKANPRKDLVARNLLLLRTALGLSQQDASTAADVPIDNLRRYEQGKTFPDSDVLQRIAAAYGHLMDDFFKEEPPPANPDARQPVLFRINPGVELTDADIAEAQRVINELNVGLMKRRKKRR